MLAERGRATSGFDAELGGRLRDRPDRAGRDVLAVHQLEPFAQRARGDRLGERGCDGLLVGDRTDARRARAGRRPRRAAARTSARARRRSASGRPRSRRSGSRRAPPVSMRSGRPLEPVRDETVRAVRHRDDERGRRGRFASRSSRAATTSSAAERPPAARSATWVGRHRRRRVGEHARPAEVVHVVAGSSLVAVTGAEAGDRAEHRRPGHRRRRAGRGRPAGSRRGRRRPGRRARWPARARPRSSGRRRPTPCRR